MAALGNDAAVQRGQVGQPSPDPVNRTAPPVIMMPTLATSEASATPRSARGLAQACPPPQPSHGSSG